MGIARVFDAVVASGDPDGPPRLKPAPGGYLKAAHKLGVRPEACLVIGDRPDTDGVAAAAAGMRFRLVG
jgi:HAD superfamily hydrolase (TIGR01509 family)